MSRAAAVLAIGLCIAFVLTVAYWMESQQGPSSRVRTAEASQTRDLRDARIEDSKPSDAAFEIAENESVRGIEQRCPNLWLDPSAECEAALDRRFGREPMSPFWLIDDVLEWHPGIAEARAEWALPGLGEDPWRRVFEDPVETRHVAVDALSRRECMVGGGKIRPRLRDLCAADEIANLALLQMACVGPLARDNAWKETGTTGRYEEDWRSTAADLAETAPDHDDYWRSRRELNEEKLRFAWRLHQCRKVPKEALAWLDAFEMPPDNSGYHQGGDLLAAAARLGSRWAAMWSLHRLEDIAVIDLWDPALGSVLKVRRDEERSLEHLMAAVELARLKEKAWYGALFEMLKSRHPVSEIRAALPRVREMYPSLPLAVVTDI